MVSLSVKNIYFDAIKSGKKTVEGRINTPKYQALAVGDQIAFLKEKTEEKIICTIAKLTTYTQFKDMLLAEGLENMLPGVASIEQGVALYESFGAYKEEVKLYGALAIKIEIKK